MQNWHATNTRSSKITSRPRARSGGDRKVCPAETKSQLSRAVDQGGRGRRVRLGPCTETYWGSLNSSRQGLHHTRRNQLISKKICVGNLKVKIWNLKISWSMVHQSNNELGLLSFWLRVLKLLSSMLGDMIINIQSSKLENLLHSQSSMGPIASMAMPLAKPYMKVSHIMEWVKSLNSFFQIHATALI